jgi:hypothetical protein
MTPQLVPSQVATPFDGIGQAVQLAPQDAVLVDETHWLPHAWYPLAQTNPQTLLVQVALPLAGAEHSEAVQQPDMTMQAVPHRL